MNRKEINRYIENLMQEAQSKVRGDCKAKREQRTRDLIEKYDLEKFTDQMRKELEPLKNSLESLVNHIVSKEEFKVEKHYLAPLTSIDYLLNEFNEYSFLESQFDRSSDAIRAQIYDIERKSLSEVRSNYQALRDNTLQMTPTKAVEYLKELGFVLPDEDNFKGIMKPLDGRFLIAKGINEDEDE